MGAPEQQSSGTTRQTGSNLVTTSLDSQGHQTTHTYDAYGNVLTATQAAGTASALTTTHTYEPLFSQVATTTDGLNHTTTYDYDARGSLTATTDPLGHQTTFTYNSQGQMTSMSDALQHTTTFAYEAGDLVRVTDPLGRTTTRFLDAIGRVVSVTDPIGRTTRYLYDTIGRLTRMTDAAGAQADISYDLHDQVNQVTDARQNRIQFDYNVMGQLVRRTDPLGRIDSYDNDQLGNRLRHTDNKGQVTSRSYDRRNRLQQVVYADGSSVAYTYDARGLVTQVVDSSAGTLLRSYDDVGRTISETTPLGGVAYTYDAAGRRQSTTVTGQPAVVYGYDAADRLVSVSQGIAQTTFAYDAIDRRTGVTLSNGVSTDYIYDDASQLSSLTYRSNSTMLGTLSYSYDATGSRIQMGGTWSRVLLPQPVGSATYDSANQLLRWGGQNFGYDLNGNLASTPSSTYQWNARNQLAQILGENGGTFQYNATGLRSSKNLGGTSTSFLYDGADVIQELNPSAPPVNRLLGPAVDEGLGSTDGTLAWFPVVDPLGSVVAVADVGGNVSSQMTYEPFGRSLSNSTTQTYGYQFIGRESDGPATYLRNRYYDPSVGRFISPDPIGLAGGMNPYSYAEGNPVNASDPSGLTVGTNWTFFWDWVLERGAAGRAYGEGTIELAEIATSPGAAAMRAAYKAGNCCNIRNGSFGTMTAYFRTAWMLNSTAAQVGGFVYDASNNGNGTVTYTVRNRAGAYSFFLHIPFIPRVLPRGGTLHLFGDINQVFTWTEPSPCCQQR